MLLICAALYEEVEYLHRVLAEKYTASQKQARACETEYPFAPLVRLVGNKPTVPMLGVFYHSDEQFSDIKQHSIALLVAGVGATAAAGAVSDACQLLKPQVVIRIGCALLLGYPGTKHRENNTQTHVAARGLAVIGAAVRNDTGSPANPIVVDAKWCTALGAAVKTRAAHEHLPVYENAYVLTGDVFVRARAPDNLPESVREFMNKYERMYTAGAHDALLLDMETAAVFHAARDLHHCACAGVLAISDVLGDSARHNFRTIAAHGARLTGDVILHLMRAAPVM